MIDILIIGGGLLGSSIAYHLARSGQAGRIVVLEADPTYERATTPRGAGGVRQLFSRPENVALGKFGLEFYRNFPQTMELDGEPADIGFRADGYLFLSDGGGADQLQRNFEVQTANGVAAELLDANALKLRYPSVNFDDVAIGVLSPDDGWIDPYAALMGFKRNAQRLGVRYEKERVTAWTADATAARTVVCESGRTLSADQFVLAAGAWSGDIAAMLDWHVPIAPMSRQTHFFRCRAEFEPLPFIKAETNLGFRPEGNGFTGGVPDWNAPSGFNWNYDPDWFETVVWPLLASRMPAMNELRLERTWACHYERCLLDDNAIIGRWEGGLENVFIASGFSGHGIMQAPGAGLAIAEIIVKGGSETLDLARLGYERVRRQKPYRELGIV